MGITPASLNRLLAPGSDTSRSSLASLLPSLEGGAGNSERAPQRAREGDSVQLSGNRISYLGVSMQLHLERSVLDQAGRAVGREILDIQILYERIEAEGFQGAPAERPEGEEDPLSSAMNHLLDYFGVEKTAQRISDFVQKGFGRTSFGETDTAESRGSFVDFILPFIRTGVDSALAMFGEMLPDEIRQQAEGTFKRVQELLEEFAGGPKPETPEV